VFTAAVAFLSFHPIEHSGFPERILMSKTQEHQAVATATREELYSIPPQAQRDYVAHRTAARWIGFFLPYLRPGMSLLDCGCGLGSITLDLAELVAPGQVIGLDIDPNQLELARSLACKCGVRNVQFAVGNVYTLPFPDAAFDAVLAHTLLLHVNDPLRALKEMHRVVKPGGMIAVADDDYSTMVASPANPLIELVGKLWVQVLAHRGGSPYYSRHLRQLLLQAGCWKTEGHAVAAEYYGRLEDTRRFAVLFEQIFRYPPVVELVLGKGWVELERLQAMIAKLRAWAERPDAFFAWMYCAAIGWVGDQTH